MLEAKLKGVIIDLQAVQKGTNEGEKLVRQIIEEYKKKYDFNENTRIIFEHKIWYIQDFGKVLADIENIRPAIQKEINGFKQINTEIAGMVDAVISSLDIRKMNSDGKLSHITQKEIGNFFGVSERSVREHSKLYNSFYNFGETQQPVKKIIYLFKTVENRILNKVTIAK